MKTIKKLSLQLAIAFVMILSLPATVVAEPSSSLHVVRYNKVVFEDAEKQKGRTRRTYHHGFIGPGWHGIPLNGGGIVWYLWDIYGKCEFRFCGVAPPGQPGSGHTRPYPLPRFEIP